MLTCFMESYLVLTDGVGQWLSQPSVACTSNFPVCVLVITRAEKVPQHSSQWGTGKSQG